MNPGSFFREVLESHEFRSSDTLSSTSRGFLTCRGAYPFMSDKANLLDIEMLDKAGRFLHYVVVKSAAAR